MDIKRCCGTCRFWIRESTYEETIQNRRKIFPHCNNNGEAKGSGSKPCLVWMAASDQELESREKAGYIKLEATVESS
ncbi:MAG: hypothetical protein ABFD18_06375 [Syntrophomonas sp.]